MRWHWQNLNERREGEKIVKGNPLKAGRAWWRFNDRKPHARGATLRFEWALGLRCGAHVELDPDENEITLNVAPIFGTFYLTLEGRLARRIVERLVPYEVRTYEGKEYRAYKNRETGFYVMDWRVAFFIWTDRNSWSRSDPQWKQFSFDALDVIFGAHKHTLEILEPERDTSIPMGEGAYAAKVKLERRTWKRSRWPWWPFTRQRTSYDFNIPDGIPFPGKGENSWDCGDGGLFGCGFSAPNEAGAIAQVTATVLTNRLRYGGRECMLRPWPETPLVRAERLANIRARRQAEELAAKHANPPGTPES